MRGYKVFCCLFLFFLQCWHTKCDKHFSNSRLGRINPTSKNLNGQFGLCNDSWHNNKIRERIENKKTIQGYDNHKKTEPGSSCRITCICRFKLNKFISLHTIRSPFELAPPHWAWNHSWCWMFYGSLPEFSLWSYSLQFCKLHRAILWYPDSWLPDIWK